MLDCRWCHVEEETTENFLCKCQAWAVLRQKVFGSPYHEAGQLRELDLGSLTLLAERINRKLGCTSSEDAANPSPTKNRIEVVENDFFSKSILYKFPIFAENVSFRMVEYITKINSIAFFNQIIMCIKLTFVIKISNQLIAI